MNKSMSEILPIDEYLKYLQTANAPADEIEAAWKAQSEGVTKVKLTFNKTGANRQFLR